MGVEGVDAPDALFRLLSWCIRVVLAVDVETTLAEEPAPILQGRRRNRAVRPVGALVGGENATLVVDVAAVALDDDAAPLDNEKYEGLSVNIRTRTHRVWSSLITEERFWIGSIH